MPVYDDVYGDAHPQVCGGPESAPPDRREILRRPCADDALGIHRLAADTGVLDVNSVYAYALLATDFADTSIVAERDGRVVGFIAGYRPPSRPWVLFVWQVAVDPSGQGAGLGGAMIDALVDRVGWDGHAVPVTVEATVAPGNSASRAFFGAFARRHGVPLTERPHFGGELLSAQPGAHDDEPMLSIGPIIPS